MSGLYPSVPEDGRVSGRLRLNTNRRQDLTVQMELDAVAMKSITEMAIKKDARNMATSGEDVLARYFTLEHVPSKVNQDK